MKTAFLALGLVALTAVFSACSTTDSRISKHQAAFDALSPEDRGKVRGGHVDLGFTQEMVQMALGEPDRRYTRTTDQGSHEVWAYRDRGPSFSIGLGVGSGGRTSAVGAGVGVTTGDRSDDKLRIVFQNGRVAAIERRDRH
ncbi:hypothetical protein DB347_22020 [Opitutaceae bacterium EW11]|nr:hypothetical protein DB347_22020 [Opitutaceae bacterium EW11]